MAITPTTINELDATVVADREELLVAELLAAHPELDLSPASVLRALLVRPAAQLYAMLESDMARAVLSNSLLTAVANPSAVDSETVDNLLGNYFITRTDAAVSSGQARVELSELRYTTISDSLRFSANGVTFKPTRSFAGVTSEATVTSTDQRLIQEIGDTGRYYFLIDVEALSATEAGNVPAGTALVPSPSLPAHVTAVTTVADFDGGGEEETDAELLARAPTGVTTPNLCSRDGAYALLSREFPSVVDASMIGAGDAEMYRDQGNTLGISAGGKADLYVRTRDAALTTTVTKTATYSSAGGGWVLNFTRDEVPGAYSVETARRSDADADDPDATVTSIVRGADESAVTGVDFSPYLPSPAHVFTRYQTMAVVLDDAGVTSPSDGDQQDYDIGVLYMPEVDAISDYCLSRGVRPAATDVLARATIPCLVAVGVVIVADPDNPDVDTDAIVAAIVEVVNSSRFADGRLPNDAIIQAVRGQLTGRAYISGPLDLRGRVILPYAEVLPTLQDYEESGNMYIAGGTTGLVAPTINALGVGRRTVSFMTYSSYVTVTVEQSDHPLV